MKKFKHFIFSFVIISLFSIGVSHRVENRELKKPGKIYLKYPVLYVGEKGSGVHFYDISDSSNIIEKNFLYIEGNNDVAVYNDVLYADSNTDLLVYKITNTYRTSLVHSIKDMFTIVEPLERDYCLGLYIPITLFGCGSSESPTTPSTGQAGSMARFAIVDSFLYCVDYSTLNVFDIKYPERPVRVGKIKVDWNIETIFPYKDYLFIGGQRGMYVYSTKWTPEEPQYITQFTHATSCDPVVVQDSVAFVTLRSGNNCGGSQNLLDIIDVSDIRNPLLIKSYSMSQPYGLAVSGNYLYLCDAGLKIFDITNLKSIRKISEVRDIKTYDVIHSGDALFITGDSGIFLFDVKDPFNPKMISRIPISRA